MSIINKYKGENYLLDVLDQIKNYKEFAKQMNEALKRIGLVERIRTWWQEDNTTTVP